MRWTRRRRWLVLALAGAFAVMTSVLNEDPARAAVDLSAPATPALVRASQDGPAADLEVSWTAGSGGSAATGAIVQLYKLPGGGASPEYVAYITCAASCTSAVFRELTFGSSYEALVFPTGPGGTGYPAASPPVALSTSCPTSACIGLDATQPIAAFQPSASGLLDSLYPGGLDELVAYMVRTTMWRANPGLNSDGSFNWSSWDAAEATGAKTTLVLSNLWSAENNYNPPTPWSNWSAYQSWVTSTVQTVLASGRRVDYWEIYNEPGGSGYYSAANQATVTPALLCQQFLVAYDAIKSVDPSAAIIGPSLTHWQDYPTEYGSTPTLDMVTFLDYAAAHNLKLAAVSWHEIDDYLATNPPENTLAPLNIVDHVAEARQLIASLPALGNPEIFINEYGMPEVQQIPGWDVAYLAALTQAQVGSAVRDCWDHCLDAALDGLLSSDGTLTMPEFWVHLAYASMSGETITATTTDDHVTALGSYDPSTRTLTALLGRAFGCNQESWCTATWPWSTLAPPAPVTVTFTVPWFTGTCVVTLHNIEGQTISPLSATTALGVQSLPVAAAGGGKGTCALTIPSFADGDAYSATVTPGS